MDPVQEGKKHGDKIAEAIVNLEDAIKNLPEGQEKTNLLRLSGVLHGRLYILAKDAATFLKVPVTTLSGGTEKETPPGGTG